MIRHSRRRFIGQLFATSFCSAMLGRTAARANDDLHFGLAELCVMTRQRGHLPKGIVDLWTAQIGDLDLAQLPEQFGRVVVWHDVRGVGELSRSVTDILSATEEYFGIKPVLGSNAAAHVGHSSGLSSSIEALLKPLASASLDQTGRRTAVVNLSSCGLTRLDWLDIIPLLRRHYTYVVGVDYSFPDLCDLDPEFEPPNGLSDVARSASRSCDFWLLASDESLSGRIELSIEERSIEFTRSIRDLCLSLGSADGDLHAAIISVAKHQFVTFGAGT